MIKIDPLSLADTRLVLHLHAIIFLGNRERMVILFVGCRSRLCLDRNKFTVHPCSGRADLPGVR